MSIWPTIIETIGGYAVAAAALAWLVRSLLAHWLSKDVENYKAALTFESARQIELFKAELSRHALESSVRFTSLHQRRLDAMAEMYFKIDSLMGDIDICLLVFNPSIGADKLSELESLTGEVNNKVEELRKFVRNNRLYFERELASAVTYVAERLAAPVSDLAVAVLTQSLPHKQDLAIKHAEVSRNWEEIKPELDRAKCLIEGKLRNILGTN